MALVPPGAADARPAFVLNASSSSSSSWQAGYCAKTDFADIQDCARGDKGLWSIAAKNWTSAALACFTLRLRRAATLGAATSAASTARLNGQLPARAAGLRRRLRKPGGAAVLAGPTCYDTASAQCPSASHAERQRRAVDACGLPERPSTAFCSWNRALLVAGAALRVRGANASADAPSKG